MQEDYTEAAEPEPESSGPLELLRGIHTPAIIVANWRGLTESVLIAGFIAGIVYATNIDLQGAPAWVAPLAGLLLPWISRTGEGIIDSIDPIKERKRKDEIPL